MKIMVNAKVAKNIDPKISDIYIVRKDMSVCVLCPLETIWDTKNGIFMAKMEDVSVEYCICDDTVCNEDDFVNDRAINVWEDIENIIIGIEDLYGVEIYDVENDFSEIEMRVISGPMDQIFSGEKIIIENQIALDIMAEDFYEEYLDFDDDF